MQSSNCAYSIRVYNLQFITCNYSRKKETNRSNSKKKNKTIMLSLLLFNASIFIVNHRNTGVFLAWLDDSSIFTFTTAFLLLPDYNL